MPDSFEYGDYFVKHERLVVAQPNDPEAQLIVAGLIRAGLKRHMKGLRDPKLGLLWQDYDKFCQMPGGGADEDFLFCRKFGIAVKPLRNSLWVIQPTVSTAVLDGKSFADYYLSGRAVDLANRIKQKQTQGNRVRRNNAPLAVRVFVNESTEFADDVKVLELEDPKRVLGHVPLSLAQQQSLANSTMLCRPFKADPVAVNLGKIRLILDTQATGEEHSETILEPGERFEIARDLRNIVDGFEVFGSRIFLSKEPVTANSFSTIAVRPPSIRVKSDRGELTLAAPATGSDADLKDRSKQRQN